MPVFFDGGLISLLQCVGFRLNSNSNGIVTLVEIIMQIARFQGVVQILLFCGLRVSQVFFVIIVVPF